ncbi:ketosteroid isomerase-like protein [Kerstersia gyiorum]|uniref:nuclear transport factor 2 family protein n=1 Tax=Kerstersia gyiorum TaxID=206506 RepID=UPI00209D569C|nr:nuclear transport factor 2 family protein [Kerstersia gyiorum]MCP1711973.1 ketosteroid isomerase-like protein [Kerstersia gyiorum]
MTKQSLPPLDQLLIKTACRELLLHTAALADQGDFQAMAAQFSADAVLQRPGGEPLQGRQAILDSYLTRPAERISMHLILGTRFLSVQADRVSAITQIQLWNALSTDSPGPFGRPARGRELVGHFNDEFRLEDGAWKIQRREAGFDLFLDIP